MSTKSKNHKKKQQSVQLAPLPKEETPTALSTQEVEQLKQDYKVFEPIIVSNIDTIYEDSMAKGCHGHQLPPDFLIDQTQEPSLLPEQQDDDNNITTPTTTTFTRKYSSISIGSNSGSVGSNNGIGSRETSPDDVKTCGSYSSGSSSPSYSFLRTSSKPLLYESRSKKNYSSSLDIPMTEDEKMNKHFQNILVPSKDELFYSIDKLRTKTEFIVFQLSEVWKEKCQRKHQIMQELEEHLQIENQVDKLLQETLELQIKFKHYQTSSSLQQSSSPTSTPPILSTKSKSQSSLLSQSQSPTPIQQILSQETILSQEESLE